MEDASEETMHHKSAEDIEVTTKDYERGHTQGCG